MQKHKLRSGVVRAAAIGAAALSASLIVGGGSGISRPGRPDGRGDAGGAALLQRERRGYP